MRNKLFTCILALSCIAKPTWAASTSQLAGWFNTSATWGGTIQSSNSRYTERDTVPLRFTGSFVPGTTTHTLLLKYDFTDSSGIKHFFCSLGSYDATVANVNLTAGISGLGSSSSWTIPTDGTLPPGAQTPGSLTTYGVSKVKFGAYTIANGVKVLPVTFTVPGTGTKAVPVLIGYGGHLATESVWGVGNGASKWPGASGKAYASIDGSSDLNVSVNPGAVIPSADLALTVSASSPIPGANITYTIAVANSGPDQATSVTVTNTLPAGVSFVSATPAPTAVSANNISFAVGSINALGSTNITLTANVASSQCASFTDKAWVASAVLEPNTLNNTNSVVSTPVDKTAPTITSCAPAQTASANASCQAAVPDFTANVSATDNCTASGLLVTQIPTAGTLVGLGTRSVTIFVADAAHNTNTCTTSFTVQDTTAPAIVSCAAPKSTSAGENCTAAVPDFTGGVAATDNCTTSGLLVSQIPIAGTVVGLGTRSVTIFVADAAHNTNICTTSFTVKDTTPPTVSCPAAVVVNTDPGTCGAVVKNIDPVFSDNCSGASVAYTLTGNTSKQGSGTASGVSFSKGVTTVTYAATDASGNTAQCTFTVTVLDDQKPSITVPADITVDPLGACGIVVNFPIPPTAMDKCDGSVSVTCTPTNASFFLIGTTPVLCTATDTAGNTSTNFFLVTVTDQANQSWPQAQLLALGTLNEGYKQTTLEQCLVSLDQSRWYKFKVTPGSRVVVTLTDLKENYDLVLYKDIAKVYEDLRMEKDVAHLSAESSGNAFAGNSFAGNAFAGNSFAGNSFAGNSFAGNSFAGNSFAGNSFAGNSFAGNSFAGNSFAGNSFAGNSFAGSPDAFEASAISPDAFTTNAFSSTAFSGNAFAPGGVPASAFSAAQMQSILAASAFGGINSEGVFVNTWDNDGDFYVRVRGRNGVFSPGNAYQLDVYEFPGACEGVTPIPVDENQKALPASTNAAPAGNFETLIITDSTRWPQGTDLTSMMDKLQYLTTNANGVVNGAVIDVGTDPWVKFFNAQADVHYDCPYAKNLVAEAIKNIIDRSRTPSLKYVVIVGSDNVIPFFRYPDEASLAPEKNYVPPVKDNTPSQASLRLNYVYGQDFYGAKCTLSLKNIDLPLPDLAVGRLVETPAEIKGMIDAYLAAPAGGVPVNSSLATGYDFLADSSTAVAFQFQEGIGGSKNDVLICQNTSAPDQCWSADDLRTKLFGARHDIIYLAGHFSAIAALAADYQTAILASELAASSLDFQNTLIFSAGCHSGYNIVTNDGIRFVTLDPDWARSAAQKQATLVAGIGYQYGDTDFIEYGERLYLEFAKQLRTGPGSGPVAVSAGDALKQAKLIYLAGTPQIRAGGIHAKSYLQATLYGLPMLKFKFQTPLEPTSSESVIGGTTRYNNDPGYTLGLRYADLPITSQLTNRTVTMTNLDVAGETVTGFYVEGGNGVINNPGEPVLPIEIRSVGVSDNVLRGVGFRGAEYTDTLGKIPFTDAATTEISGVHTPFLSEVFYPVRFWNVNYFGALCGLGDGATRLVTIPAQFQSDSAETNTGTFRKFTSLNFRLFYSNNLTNYGTDAIPSVPGLSGPPSISAIQGITSADKSEVALSARVVGNPAAGIQNVWVTFTGTNETYYYGKWQSIDLVQNSDDSTLWEGTLPLNGSDSQAIRYMVQAVNGVGEVTADLKLGAYHIPDEFDSANTAQLTPTRVDILQNPGQGAFADTVQFQAKLSYNQTALSGKRLVFSVGGQEIWALTGVDGVAAATMKLQTIPAQYNVAASFLGSAGYAPSFDYEPMLVVRQTAGLTMNTNVVYVKPRADSGIITTLKDGLGNPIHQRTMFFVIYQEATTNVSSVRAVITDMLGRAPLGKLGQELTDGRYTLTAYFDGTIPLPDGTTISVDDGLYIPTNTVGTLNVVQLVVDGTAPSLTCPADVTQSTDPGQCTATVTLPSATVNDANANPVVYNPASGVFSKGTTNVTCVATDKAGNTSTCTFKVNVVDTENPTISCPADVNVYADAGACIATGVVLGSPITGDNCGTVTVNSNAPALFPVGTNLVTWTATDASGNSATCHQRVIVQDNQFPTITCPADVTVNVNAGVCVATGVVLGSPITSDNCGTATISSNAPAQFPVGTNLVTWTASDARGNSTTCQQRVIVRDNQAPVITCPADITVSAASAGTVVTFSVSATDKCGVVQVKSVPDSGNSFPIGTNVVTSTATDSSGNTATCSFKVIVLDVAPPTFCLSVSPAQLSPPNHQMVLVSITVDCALDNSGLFYSTMTNVVSSEPINGTGDGDQAPDWVIPTPFVVISNYPGILPVYLRSERAQSGRGRYYTNTVTTYDSSGNTTTRPITVFVPK